MGPAAPGALSVGIDQILLPATAVIGAASFHRDEILGQVLRSETDALFANRERSRRSMQTCPNPRLWLIVPNLEHAPAVSALSRTHRRGNEGAR
jgi:hypothetical protein